MTFEYYYYNGNYRIYYYNNSSYYLCLDSSNLKFYTGYAYRDWQLYKVQTTPGTQTQPVDPLTASDQQISYIQDNGVAAPLTQMLRNQKVTVTLNVYFEETSGEFRFYVEEWSTDHNNSTNFD